MGRRLSLGAFHHACDRRNRYEQRKSNSCRCVAFRVRLLLPYTIIKEVNPPQMGGTATGVINFINFTFSALLGPVFAWLLRHVSGGTETFETAHYQTAFAPLLFGLAVAAVLTFLLKETGSAALASSDRK